MRINYNKKQLEKLAREFKLQFVILHGSHTTGALHKESDFDVAVLGQTELDFQALLRLHEAFGKIFRLQAGMDLDIKSLYRADPLFRYEVTSTGRLLFGDAAAYEEFKAISLRMYEDARALFDLERHLAYKYQRHLNSYAQPKIRVKKN